MVPEMISALPPRLAAANVPRLFAVTALAEARDCRLRLVLQSQSIRREIPRLPAGPAAALGTLAHRYFSARAVASEMAVSLFERIHREFAGELATNSATTHYADLPSVIGLSAWSRFRLEVIERRKGSAPVLPPSRPRSAVRGTIFGRERPLASQRLRLNGRADKITRLQEGTIEIRDYKTGEILDTDGEILAHIAFQLRAYGLLVLEQSPGLPVRLIVDDGTEHDVGFTTRDQRRVRRLVNEINSDLPAGRRLDALSLATAGEACTTCAFRHCCGAYLDAAPAWWRMPASGPADIPRDVWGVVVQVSSSADGVFSVAITDAIGRRVRLDRLDSARWREKPKVGDTVWAFNLESPVSRARARAAKLHPTSFYECPADSTQQRAWALQLFSP